MSTDKDPKPKFQFLTTGVVKDYDDDKFSKAQAHGFKGPGVVRGIKPGNKKLVIEYFDNETNTGLKQGGIGKIVK